MFVVMAITATIRLLSPGGRAPARTPGTHPGHHHRQRPVTPGITPGITCRLASRLLKARPKARVACTAISNDSSWSEFEVGTYSSTFGELDSMEAEFRRQFHSKRRARHRVPSMPLGQLLRALGIASTTRSRFT